MAGVTAALAVVVSAAAATVVSHGETVLWALPMLFHGVLDEVSVTLTLTPAGSTTCSRFAHLAVSKVAVWQPCCASWDVQGNAIETAVL